MTTIGSLAEWIGDSGRWTGLERERLRALIRKLPGGRDLQIVFGEADDGAPWCAIINQAGEVLVHVARLASELVVHVTGQEVVACGDDLRDALGPGPQPADKGVTSPRAGMQRRVEVMFQLAVARLLALDRARP